MIKKIIKKKNGNAEELRKEVEIAKLKDELSYFHEQQKKFVLNWKLKKSVANQEMKE